MRLSRYARRQIHFWQRQAQANPAGTRYFLDLMNKAIALSRPGRLVIVR